jgi:hypothetical protein
MTPLGLVIMLGIHFSLIPAAIWPCIPLLVQETSQGVGFAIVSALMNASLTG